jgi:hypothetical protein
MQNVRMRQFVFADEAGDFDFSRRQNVSRYFIVCAIHLNSCEIGHELLRLRRDLLWDGVELPDGYFHATRDPHFVRERVFGVLNSFEFDVYAQILEKSKAQQQVRDTNHSFYKYAWYYLFRHSMRRIITSIDDQLMMTTASIGVKKGQADFSDAMRDVLQQTQRVDAGSWRAAFVPSMSDPCLQAADYCTWAIQRKWERGDDRWYKLIKRKIRYEYSLWAHGREHHY